MRNEAEVAEDSEAARDDVVVDAGPSTDQHITGARESGTFLTDEPPRVDTPATGSSNRGINKRHANRGSDAAYRKDRYDS